VRLTGGPLKAAQDADAAFLLSMDPNRALAALRTAAGIDPKAQPLAGWDAPNGRTLAGHIAGHLLSAYSLMYAATGKEEFKTRADAMVAALAEIQAKNGDGYIGAQKDSRNKSEREIFKDVSNGILNANYESLNGLWSPWYVHHKMFAGLRDAYRHTGNKKALEVETALATWAETVLARLTDEQIQKMLDGEFGGMGEVLVNLYEDTGDKRWLDLSYKFEHKSFIQPLAAGEDKLGNTHGNHNIPTLMGSAERYAAAARPEDLAAADFFWKAVVDHHTFATGGNSGAADGEFFPYTDKLGEMIAKNPGAPTNESCNVYNMLKLTRTLFSFQPDARYADYLERALFNHSLTQIKPDNGLMAYHVSVGQGVRLDYQGTAGGQLNSAFTCCVGTGMENPALYADGIYCAAADKLWVNLYAPSTADWAAQNAQLKMETALPEGDSAKLTLTLKAPKTFTLALRRPAWTTAGFNITINGEAQKLPAIKPGTASGTYIELARAWKSGDTIELTIPKELRVEYTPDDPTLGALMWGPLVLGADLGTTPLARGPATASRGPAIVRAAIPGSDWLKPVSDKPGQFRVETGRNATAPADNIPITFVPLYRLHDHTYSVYMSIYTPDAWAAKTGSAR
jgi:DUF1680 family protein